MIAVAKKTLGKYEIVERLGRGGMAEVFKGYHAALDRFVAIKLLHGFLADDPEFKSRFEREAQNVARLKHPNIVQVYDFEYDRAHDSYYMVMEYIDGPTLKDRIFELTRTDEHLPLAESLRIIHSAGQALAYAHRQGMIHRDVKPANLMLDRDGRVVLTDFGIAKIVSGVQFTASGGMVGTPAYMAPEQGLGEAGDERSDIYSLGIILFQLATGRLPYEADTPLATILKHLNEPIPQPRSLNPALPAAVENIILTAIAKQPADRYSSAAVMVEHIEALLADERLLASQPFRDNAALSLPAQARAGSSALHDDALDETARGLRRLQPHLSRTSWLLLSVIALLVAGSAWGLNNGFFSITVLATATPTPTSPSAALPSLAATATTTATPSLTATGTSTVTPTPTVSPTVTTTPTESATPTLTLTPTPDITQTLAQGTLVAAEMTATVSACVYDYAIIKPDLDDPQLEYYPAYTGGSAPVYIRTETAFSITITLLNAGDCAWERNTSLTWLEGESFNAGPRIFIRNRIEVGEEAVIEFSGTTPPRGRGGVRTGTWELRTPGQLPIGEPLTLSIFAYDN